MEYLIIENITAKEIATLNLSVLPRKAEKLLLNNVLYNINEIVHSDKIISIVVSLLDSSIDVR